MSLAGRLSVAGIAVLAAGVVLFHCAPPPESEGAPTEQARERNRPFEAVPSQPSPLVVAWEMAGHQRPTFVLYDDGQWIRARIPDRLSTEIGGHETGRLPRERADELYDAVAGANLISLPAYSSVRHTMIGGNAITIAVRLGAKWHLATVHGILPRFSRAELMAAWRREWPEGAHIIYRFLMALDEPVPEPFLNAYEPIVMFEPDERQELASSSWAVFAWPSPPLEELDPGERARYRPWPVTFPRPTWPADSSEGARLFHLPDDSVDEVRREIERLSVPDTELSELDPPPCSCFHVDGRTFGVSHPFHPFPAEDHLWNLFDAFDRFPGDLVDE